MRRIPALVFASLALVVASLSAKAAAQDGDVVALVAPADGETVCLMNDGNRAFVEMDAPSRRSIFKDKAWRHDAATKWRSLPSPVHLEWKCAKEGGARVTVTKKGDAAPWFDERVEGSSADVWNLEIAREYEWTVSCGGQTARGTFRTMDLPPRVMHGMGGPRNFRDFGGWRTLDGRRVRQGLVYRSQGLNGNAHYYLNSKETMALYKAGKLEELYGKLGAEIKSRIDKEGGNPDFDPNAPWMRKSIPRKDPRPNEKRLSEATLGYYLGKLRIKTDIDLRGPTEVWGMTGSPLGPSVRWVNISSHAYGGMGEPSGRDAFREVFKVFLDRKNYPIIFHCIGGADRTGCDAWVMNGLLGVAEDDLMKDWEITCFEYESQSFGHDSRIAHFLRVLDGVGGATMREKCENYVKSLGFTDADIATFREIMLE